MRFEPRDASFRLSGMGLPTGSPLNGRRLSRPRLRFGAFCFFVVFSMTIWLLVVPSLFGQTAKGLPSDGIQYVSAKGTDSNDGLSWGTAKATLAEAVAVTNASDGGGRIYVGAGRYTWSSTITLTKPVRLQCAPGRATHFAYTGASGAAIKLAWGSQKDGAGIYGCYLTGPGATTNTSGIQITDASSYVSGAIIENVAIGVHDTPSSGFGVGIEMPTNTREIQNIQIVNPMFLGLGIGVNAYGEQETIRGGSISECTTSVMVQTSNTEVTSTGTSYDSDQGPYIVVHGGIFTSVGDHYETNPAPLTSDGFIQNGGRVTVVGGTLMDDLKSGTQPAFITDTATTGSLYVFGTTAWSGGQTVTYLATPPPMGGIDGVIAFHNMMTDNRTPPWPSTGTIGAGRLTVIPSHTRGISYEPHVFYHQTLKFGGNNAAYNMATLDAHALNGSYTYTFPNSGGELALSGANGISAGTIRMDGGRGLHNFAKPYSEAPVCFAADATSEAAVSVRSTTTAVSVTGNGADIVKWTCSPVAN